MKLDMTLMQKRHLFLVNLKVWNNVCVVISKLNINVT